MIKTTSTKILEKKDQIVFINVIQTAWKIDLTLTKKKKEKQTNAVPPALHSFALSLKALLSATANLICKHSACCVLCALKRNTRFQLLYCGTNINHLRYGTFVQLAGSRACYEGF